MSKLHPRKWPLKIKWIWTESILEPCRKLIEIGCKPHLGPDEISNISYSSMQFVCITICHNFYGCVKNTFDFLGRINVICQSKVEFVVWTKWDWFIQIKLNYISTKLIVWDLWNIWASLSPHSRQEISKKNLRSIKHFYEVHSVFTPIQIIKCRRNFSFVHTSCDIQYLGW